MMDTPNFIHTILQIGEQQQQELKRKKDERHQSEWCVLL
jgi:hypothetical protein